MQKYDFSSAIAFKCWDIELSRGYSFAWGVYVWLLHRMTAKWRDSRRYLMAFILRFKIMVDMIDFRQMYGITGRGTSARNC